MVGSPDVVCLSPLKLKPAPRFDHDIPHTLITRLYHVWPPTVHGKPNPNPSHFPSDLLRISRDETARLRPHVGLVVEVWDSFDQVYGVREE